MRFGVVCCWLVFGLHLCRGDEAEKAISLENTVKRPQWNPPARNPASAESSPAVNDQSRAAPDGQLSASAYQQILWEACGSNSACLADRAGLEAITMLHRQLDDDANGKVDLSESDDFLREELQYDSGYEKRQRAFHHNDHNDDMHISVRELWEAWLRSEVHNWTTEQTVEWLTASVELPQYKTLFLQHHVTGATLPRLAVNNMQYLSNVLGIKDPIHKQKLALKAMDVVLFGPPKGSRWKDWLLACLILGAVFGGWAALRAGRASRSQVQRMLRDMEQLRKAEMALDDMQKELEKARLEQENVNTEKLNLERKLREAGDGPALPPASSDVELSQLRAEIEMLRGELRRAEGELEDRCWAPPPGLQQWLQLTHEVENRNYLRRKQLADAQLQQARDACEKLRKKRSSLVGAFVSTHGKSIDEVDRSIVEARTALSEVTLELQERVHRWKQIELLCGFNIVNNAGLALLEQQLYRGGNGRARMRTSASQDDLSVCDDAGSLHGGSNMMALPSLPSLGNLGMECGGGGYGYGKEDSSGSEEPEPPHYPLELRLQEARQQLEDRLAMEARGAAGGGQQDAGGKRLSADAPAPMSARGADDRRTNYDRCACAAEERRARDAPGSGGGGGGVHFILGGDNVNWTGEELVRAGGGGGGVGGAAGLRGSMRSAPALHATAPPAAPGAPLPPPRRPHPHCPMLRSRSSDVMSVPAPAPGSPEDTRHTAPLSGLRSSFGRQRTLAEETVSLCEVRSASPPKSPPAQPASLTQPAQAVPLTQPAADDSTDSSLMEDEGASRPRRRKIHFPFSKKSKLHA